jgi:hypothetical protein
MKAAGAGCEPEGVSTTSPGQGEGLKTDSNLPAGVEPPEQ